jgi:hypothetical protein
MRAWCIAILLLHRTAAPAQTDSIPRHVPRWSARTQFAGQQGTGSVGLQWSSRTGRWQAAALYGYSPAQGLPRAFHAAVLRCTVQPARFDRVLHSHWSLSPILSASGLVELGGISFLALPSEYIEDYYSPQAAHALLSIGLRASHPARNGRIAFTVETVSLDTHLWYALRDSSIRFSDAWSLALGLEWYFGPKDNVAH